MIERLGEQRLILAWLALIGATLISWELGHGVGITDPRIAGALVMAVAFIKVRVVFFEFMELRHTPRYMRLAANLWLVLVCTALIILYFQAPTCW
jgi:hypothetical protein